MELRSLLYGVGRCSDRCNATRLHTKCVIICNVWPHYVTNISIHSGVLCSIVLLRIVRIHYTWLSWMDLLYKHTKMWIDWIPYIKWMLILFILFIVEFTFLKIVKLSLKYKLPKKLPLRKMWILITQSCFTLWDWIIIIEMGHYSRDIELSSYKSNVVWIINYLCRWL